MQEYKDKIQQLERTLLELGTELYRMKTEMSTYRASHENFLDVMKGLKTILDDKGLITAEDFENAVELGHAIAGSPAPSFDPLFEAELNKIKKTSH